MIILTFIWLFSCSLPLVVMCSRTAWCERRRRALRSDVKRGRTTAAGTPLLLTPSSTLTSHEHAAGLVLLDGHSFWGYVLFSFYVQFCQTLCFSILSKLYVICLMGVGGM